MSDTTKVYEVRDGDGALWAAYCYRAMAEAVRERCDNDPAMADRTPFMVIEVQP